MDVYNHPLYGDNSFRFIRCVAAGPCFIYEERRCISSYARSYGVEGPRAACSSLRCNMFDGVGCCWRGYHCTRVHCVHGW